MCGNWKAFDANAFSWPSSAVCWTHFLCSAMSGGVSLLSKMPERAWLKPRKHRSIGSEFHPRLRISSSQILAFGKLLWTKRARGSMYVNVTYDTSWKKLSKSKKISRKTRPSLRLLPSRYSLLLSFLRFTHPQIWKRPVHPPPLHGVWLKPRALELSTVSPKLITPGSDRLRAGTFFLVLVCTCTYWHLPA